jgi:hypothetical protein
MSGTLLLFTGTRIIPERHFTIFRQFSAWRALFVRVKSVRLLYVEGRS